MKSATPLRHSTAYLVPASVRARALARGEKSSCFLSPFLTSVATCSSPLVSTLTFRAPFTPPYVTPSSSFSSSSRFPPVAALHRAHCLHVHCHAAPHTRVDTARRIAKTHVSSSSFAASSSCRRFRCDLCGKDEVMGNLRVNRRRERRRRRYSTLLAGRTHATHAAANAHAPAVKCG